MGIFSFLKGMGALGSAEGTRNAMLQSYRKHRSMLEGRPDGVPPGTSSHEAALYGALATRYRTAGIKEEAIHRMEYSLWLELLPFVHLPEQTGPEALAEYIVWKEVDSRPQARLEWLRESIKKGVREAERSGKQEAVEAAMGKVFEGSSPWAEMM